jgi:Cdc6-like AAA superfamily ATPase
LRIICHLRVRIWSFVLFVSTLTWLATRKNIKMSYLVTARKWRPQVFEDLVGQEHISTTLKNALGTNRLSHAYLFAGPRGVGKTTTARILAKAVNCLHPKNFNPDNECEICKEITEGRSLDVLEIDGASNRGIQRFAENFGRTAAPHHIYFCNDRSTQTARNNFIEMSKI